MRGYSNLVTSHREADPCRLDQCDHHGRRCFHRGFLSDAALAGISKTIKARASEHLSGSSDRSSFWQGFHGERTTRFTGLGRDTEYFFDLLEDLYLARSLMRCCKPVAKDIGSILVRP